ncbi:hypothetical protein PRIC2_010612 [Phytophthora ramorum]
MSRETAIRTARGDNVQADDVYVLFSSVPRTIESVLCLLRGFIEQQKVPLFYVHTSKIERGGLWQRLYRRKDFCYGALKDGVKAVHGFAKALADNKQPAELSFFPAHHNSIVALLGMLQIDVGSQLPQYGGTSGLHLGGTGTRGRSIDMPAIQQTNDTTCTIKWQSAY